MSEPQTTATPKKLARKKIINVIYFVDADQTKSFKMSLGRFRALLACFVGILIWAFASLWFIYMTLEDQNALKKRTQENLATIFEYQSRYDHVYELAYPNAKSKGSVNTDQVSSLNESPEPERADKDEDSSISLAAKTTNKQSRPVVAQTTKSENEQAAKPTAKRPYVAVKRPEFKGFDRGFGLKFAVTNVISPTKVDGYVYGVAVFTSDEGNAHYIGSPTGIKVDDQGRVASPRSAFKYAIRRFKYIDMSFEPPKNISGKFKEIQITLMDDRGNMTQHKLEPPAKLARVEVEKDLPNPPKTPSEQSDSTDNQHEDTVTESLTPNHGS